MSKELSPSRIIVLYSLPRSGSTYVDKALRTYFATHYGHTALSELFNLNLPVTFNHNEFQLDHSSWKDVTYAEGLEQQEHLDKRIERFNQLTQQSKGQYSLKVLGAQLDKKFAIRLMEESTVYFSYRENCWEHLLSFLISFQTNQFYENDSIKWDEGSLVADHALFQKFCWLQLRYKLLREVFPQSVEISFEKLLQQKDQYMHSLGFTRDFSWENVEYPKKQNSKDKQLAFANIEELKTWYRGSFLMERYSL